MRPSRSGINELKARTRSGTAQSPDYQLHWHSLDFKFFSTLTAVHRLSNAVCFSVPERERCLYAARRALQCVKAIQDLAKQQDHFLEDYSPYLAWYVGRLEYAFVTQQVLFIDFDLQDDPFLPDLTFLYHLLQRSRYIRCTRLPAPSGRRL